MTDDDKRMKIFATNFFVALGNDYKEQPKAANEKHTVGKLLWRKAIV
jgi:hypothetical protein